ncbi:MAG TPA: hypothetical protein VGA55_06535 [Bacteroidota bacterium]
MTARIVSAVVLFFILIGGCSTASRLQSSFGTKYKYTYRLVSPFSGRTMSFQDTRLRILFRIDDSAIRFKLQNLSASTMKVVWEDASIGVRNRFYAVRNTRTLYLPSYRDNAVPAIMQGGYVIDLAIPAENISFDGEQWAEKDLLPTTDRESHAVRQSILNAKGNAVNVLLPIRVGEEVVNYTFKFEVTAVNVLPWERYKKPRRPLPPVSLPEPAFAGTDQIITAVIVASVVGISAILLTQKKSPPSE